MFDKIKALFGKKNEGRAYEYNNGQAVDVTDKLKASRKPVQSTARRTDASESYDGYLYTAPVFIETTPVFDGFNTRDDGDGGSVGTTSDSSDNSTSTDSSSSDSSGSSDGGGSSSSD